MSPLITIITVTYNAEEYLEQTIKSVINQTYNNIEYIVIDGNSTDKTVEIIKQYENNITQWVSERDSGIYEAMNKGISKAKGKWIQFLNAGDTLADKDVVSNLIPYFIEENDLIHGLMWRNKDGRFLAKPSPIDKPFDGMFIWHPTLFCKSSILKEHPFNPFYKIAGDYDFFLKCITLNYNIKFVEIAITDYMEYGVSQQNNIKPLIEAIFAQSQYLDDSRDVFKHNYMNALIEQRPDKNYHFSKDLNSVMNTSEKLLQGKSFILYGYGVFGKIIYNQFKENILTIIDQNASGLINDIKINNLDSLTQRKENEFIFISVLGRENEIKDMLMNKYNIPEEFILMCKI